VQRAQGVLGQVCQVVRDWPLVVPPGVPPVPFYFSAITICRTLFSAQTSLIIGVGWSRADVAECSEVMSLGMAALQHGCTLMHVALMEESATAIRETRWESFLFNDLRELSFAIIGGLTAVGLSPADMDDMPVAEAALKLLTVLPHAVLRNRDLREAMLAQGTEDLSRALEHLSMMGKTFSTKGATRVLPLVPAALHACMCLYPSVLPHPAGVNDLTSLLAPGCVETVFGLAHGPITGLRERRWVA